MEKEKEVLLQMLICEVEASGEAEGVLFGPCRYDAVLSELLDKLMKKYKT